MKFSPNVDIDMATDGRMHCIRIRKCKRKKWMDNGRIFLCGYANRWAFAASSTLNPITRITWKLGCSMQINPLFPGVGN